ncbi:MAG: WecB/TagA/CpsF family glycosyltransferase, partial [Cyanobacteria bacterium]|nr:WecB/TagA/CpsF family glycosyltransferase [Cyanobacteriota bacterium]
VPDGQPVRWALNLLYQVGLNDRVYGPTLMLKLCERAAQHHIPIYLYGSRPEVLQALPHRLQHMFPQLIIAGMQPSDRRQVSEQEQATIIESIRATGAQLVFVGLGCPRQEIWVYENRDRLSMPAIAVGAAFDFHAGLIPQAPPWMQKRGLEWLFRLLQEPRRLWRRYIFFNPLYIFCFTLQYLRLKSFAPSQVPPPKPLNYS